jgi:hypothetical protein
MDDDKKQQQEGMNLNINFDTTPILFTDNVMMNTNSDGITLNFLQQLMNTNQLRVVGRVGMSREHAKKLVKEMGRLLAMTEGQGSTMDTKKKN